MFKKNHIGRPSNDEIRARKIKKLVVIGIPVATILIVSILISTGNLKKLMGSSIANHYCSDSSWKYDGHNCVRTTIKKAELYADINLDGLVDNEDLNLLKFYIDNNSNIDYSIMSDTQLYFSDLNKDYEVNEEDIQILENIINNPEQINNKKVCDRGYVLNGDNCELKETVAAEIDDGSVGWYSSQGTNKVSFGFADFYKTKVGNTNVYWQAVDAVAGNKDILIEKLNNLKSENEAYLVASNIILYSYDTYNQFFNEGAEIRSAGNASYENYINLMNSPIGDLSNALGSIIRHENGHIIDFMNQKITGQYLHDLSYDGYTVSQYMECYKNMKPLNNPLSGKKLSSCFCPDCLRDYSYRKVVEFWADLFASIEYEYEWTVLKENTLNDELRELRDYLAQTYISNYNKNKTKVREIQKEYSNIYYVNYDANGGTGKMNPQIFFTGKTGWLQKNEFKNGEKTFKGWRAKRSNGEWYCYSDYSKSTLMWNSKGYCDNFGYYLFKDSDYIYNLAKTDDYVTMYAQWDYPMS